ncbi:hypothetical protein YC2023_068217 [Brassica napus]
MVTDGHSALHEHFALTCVMVIVHYTAVETSIIGWRGQHTQTEQTKNRDVVLKLYDALRSRDVDSVHRTLTPDLDYWFHGPPPHQFLMRTLTGVSPPFQFSPLSVVSFGSTVIAEGCDAASSVSWIHAWTVSHGVITQVREYSNTSLTVTRIGSVVAGRSAEIRASHCPSVWESKFSGRAGKSVPGLVLAI